MTIDAKAYFHIMEVAHACGYHETCTWFRRWATMDEHVVR
jgi:hypothetical protein